MPFSHMYACANPLVCRTADKQLRNFLKMLRGDSAKYYMASYYHAHYNIDDINRWW